MALALSLLGILPPTFPHPFLRCPSKSPTAVRAEQRAPCTRLAPVGGRRV